MENIFGKLSKWVTVTFYVICVLMFFNTCNSCSSKKQLKKVVYKVDSLQTEVNVLQDSINSYRVTLDELEKNQVDGKDVMHLYLNTAPLSRRTFEQVSKDSVLSKMIKK